MGHGRAIVFDNLKSLKLESARPVIYDRDIGLRLLYQDPDMGAEHYLIRYPPGLKAQSHRHSAAHTIVVIDGQLAVNGQVIGPGSYCHFPAGETMRHAPADDGACLFVTIFDGPFDVEPISE